MTESDTSSAEHDCKHQQGFSRCMVDRREVHSCQAELALMTNAPSSKLETQSTAAQM